MKKIIIILGLLILSAAVYLILIQKSEAPAQIELNGQIISFENPKKSAHYESNTPMHSAILAAPPLNVVIDFNFDLTDPSSISILKDGEDYGIDSTIIDPNKLSMRRTMNQAAPDGIYKVEYKACWPDKTCHDGFFQFAVDRTAIKDYLDFRNQKEVFLEMKNIKFSADKILISRGTKVTWKNADPVDHYINADPHPGHTYILDLNSETIIKDQSYSYIFKEPGLYFYHCSAHPKSMTASLVVE